jgi:hypothetical protein
MIVCRGNAACGPGSPGQDSKADTFGFGLFHFLASQ